MMTGIHKLHLSRLRERSLRNLSAEVIERRADISVTRETIGRVFQKLLEAVLLKEGFITRVRNTGDQICISAA